MKTCMNEQSDHEKNVRMKKSEKDVNMFSDEIYFLGFVQENVFGECNMEAFEK